MSLPAILSPASHVTAPPPGSVNVRIGPAVTGPGGRWIPCASAIAGGGFAPGVFEVGSGRHQVCAPFLPASSPDEALALAMDLASVAAA